MSLKNQLKFFRKTLNLTQQDMALKLNITQACYNRYEKGIREPNIDIIKKLCVIFGCTADELLEIDTPGERAKVNINNSFNNSNNINVKIKK